MKSDKGIKMKTTLRQMMQENAKNINVLIAEDDLVQQALYKRLFDGMFCSVVIKNNGAQAYEYFIDNKNKPVDLIITDNYMPQMNGMELVQKIRERSFDVRIVVMTSEEDFNLMRNYMLNGVDAILPKPYNEELTTKVLERILHHINEKKLLEYYVEQLELMAQENVVRKAEQIKKRTSQKAVETSQEPAETSIVEKYKIRESISDMENVDDNHLDSVATEKIDDFREKIWI